MLRIGATDRVFRGAGTVGVKSEAMPTGLNGGAGQGFRWARGLPALVFPGAGAHNGVMALLTREQIEAALVALDAELGRAGERASVYLVGGAVMCLVLRARASTKDVDDWFDVPAAVRAAAKRVASAMDLPDDWLNDAAKAFVPPNASFESWRSLPNLEILAADLRTLFAMKCAAARTDEDAGDIRTLAAALGVRSSEDALAIVLGFFPPERLSVRSRLLLEELLDS